VTWLRVMALRIRGMFAKRRRDRELDEELQAHLEMLAEENVQGGMPDEQARRAAKIALGGADQIKEAVRDQRGVPFVESLATDVRFGIRMLAKRPGFTTVAVLTLALCIGANTAIFSVVNAALLRPLPYPQSKELVWITEITPPPFSGAIVRGADYLEWREQSRSFAEMGAYAQPRSFNLTGEGKPERVGGAVISASLLKVLETPLAQGRMFSGEEDAPNGNPVAIVTSRLWRRVFGAGTRLSNQTLTLDGRSYAIVGVLPDDFQFPQGPGADVLIPLALDPVAERRPLGPWVIVDVIGRLKPGVGIEQASAELAAIRKRSAATPPAPAAPLAGGGKVPMAVSPPPQPQIKLTALHEYFAGDTRPVLTLLMAAVAIVLLIGCLNLANLLLAYSATRDREFAIRAALGADRKRLIRQILTESCLLALAGGSLALLVGWGGVRLFRAFLPNDPANSFLGQLRLEVDGRVFLFTLALSLLTGVAIGLLPAIGASRRLGVNETLKAGSRGTTTTSRRNPARSLMIVSQLALALILLVGAGLLLKSLQRLLDVNPGFEPENVLTFSLYLPPVKYPTDARRTAFFDQLLQRMNSLPGAEATGLSDTLPLQGNPAFLLASLAVPGQPAPPPDQSPFVTVETVSAGYFEAMGTTVIRGRVPTIGDTKDAPPVAVASAALAEHYWGNKNPIGERVQLPSFGQTMALGPPITIVGVVADVRRAGLNSTPERVLYLPLDQWRSFGFINVAVRARIDSASLTSAARNAVLGIDPDLPVYDVATMEDRVAESLSPRRFNALLVAIFSALALVLATVGIYGVIGFSVAQRTHEIGVRMALGAQADDLLLMVLAQGMMLAIAGVGVGLVGAFALTRLMTSFLFEVSATDPLTLTVVSGLIIATALAACWIPARRAMQVDPMVALRYE